MKASLLMRIAGGLSLFTCLGHTAGTFMPIPAEQPAVAAAFQLMQETLVPMPFGRPQSYADIFLGVNLCLMVQLLTYGLMLFVLSSRLTQDRTARLIAMFIALALTATAAISARYFFPLPAFCTALAAIAVALALAVSRRSLAMEHS
ncbi:MAG: hypothetical protein K1X75_16100 [Leptospirales bacterium]|nr:hypothetical protein [Leptospirales bacterium]